MADLYLTRASQLLLRCILTYLELHYNRNRSTSCLLIATLKSNYTLNNHFSVKMLASSNVQLGVLANSCLKPERAEVNVRRNYLVLFD